MPYVDAAVGKHQLRGVRALLGSLFTVAALAVHVPDRDRRSFQQVLNGKFGHACVISARGGGRFTVKGFDATATAAGVSSSPVMAQFTVAELSAIRAGSPLRRASKESPGMLPHRLVLCSALSPRARKARDDARPPTPRRSRAPGRD